MKKQHQRIFLGGLIALALGLSAGCGATPAAEVPNLETASVPAEEIPLGFRSAHETYTLGETAAAKSYLLTVDELNALECKSLFARPETGSVYLEVVLSIGNTSDRELILNSVIGFYAYLDGRPVSEYMFAHMHSEYEALNGTIKPGETMQGSLCYQVPSDWHELRIEVDLGLSPRDHVELVLYNV